MIIKQIHKFHKDYIRLFEEDIKIFRKFLLNFTELYYKIITIDNYAEFINKLYDMGYGKFEIQHIVENPDILFVISLVNYNKYGCLQIELSDLSYRCIQWLRVPLINLLDEFENYNDSVSTEMLKKLLYSLDVVGKNVLYDALLNKYDNQSMNSSSNSEDDEILF